MPTEKTPEASTVVVVPKHTPPLVQNMPVTVDRDALKRAILSFAAPGAKQDWCIACGAGASASPLDKVEALQPLTKEVLGGKTLPEFLKELGEFGQQAWCIACGAGKSANPLDTLGDPAHITDELIDALAGRLISAVRVG